MCGKETSTQKPKQQYQSSQINVLTLRALESTNLIFDFDSK